LNVAENGAVPQQVAETAEKLPGTTLLIPVGLHHMLSVLKDQLEGRDYVYRQGSNTAVLSVLENAHRGYFYAPGSTTAILAGGTWRPLLQSSNMAAFAVNDTRYVTSEDDGKTYRVTLENDGKLTAAVFAERGGTSVVRDSADNVFIASDQIYVYNSAGKLIGVLEIPERPGSLAFGGPDKQTLFIGARGSIYSIRTAAPGVRGKPTRISGAPAARGSRAQGGRAREAASSTLGYKCANRWSSERATQNACIGHAGLP
jgi:hypothetical protein